MTMKEEKQTVVNHIYGFQFNGCQMSNPTFQTVVRGDMNDGERVDDSPEASPEPEADDSPIPEVLLTDGIPAGPSAGATLYAARTLLEKGKSKSALCIFQSRQVYV